MSIIWAYAKGRLIAKPFRLDARLAAGNIVILEFVGNGVAELFFAETV
jgi:hypothetical protein